MLDPAIFGIDSSSSREKFRCAASAVFVSAFLAAGFFFAGCSGSVPGVIIEFSGQDQNDYGVRDTYHLSVNGEGFLDFDEKRQALTEGDPEDWDDYRLVIPPERLRVGVNELTISLDPADIPPEVNKKHVDAHLNFDFFRMRTTNGDVLIDVGARDASFKELDTESTSPDHVAVVDLTRGGVGDRGFPAHLQGPVYGLGLNGGARGPRHDDYDIALTIRFRLAVEK